MVARSHHVQEAPAVEPVLGMALDIRKITSEQLMQLGMANLAYVKPVRHNGQDAFAIHAADGSPMALAADRELAVAAIVQHEMVAALVH